MQPITRMDLDRAMESFRAFHADAMEQATVHAPPDLSIPIAGGCAFLLGVGVLLLIATKRLAATDPPPSITKWHLIYGACLTIIALMVPAMAGVVPATTPLRYAAGYGFMGASGVLFFAWLFGMPSAVRERIEESSALMKVRDSINAARQELHKGLPHGG